MIKYALELIEAQSAGDDVNILIPGKISVSEKKRKKIKIVRKGNYKGVPVYSIVNPLPVPMANGIRDIEMFTSPCDESVYVRYLKALSPDLIHVHTFMGLHAEFLSAAVKCGIPVVYTTHDYFGICPKADLFCNGTVCTEPGKYCASCCEGAFSEKRLLLEQSDAYRFFRSSRLLTGLAQAKALKKSLDGLRSHDPRSDEETVYPADGDIDYSPLLDRYKKMFKMVTYFHFNSSLARRVYERHLGHLSGDVIGITSPKLSDDRRERSVGDLIRIGYFGGNTPFKGLHLLQEAIDDLVNEGIKNILLRVYGNTERRDYEFCRYYDAFSPDEIGDVFEGIDILAVPSRWQETFGMVVPEAISYGIPVLVTKNVGAVDYLDQSPEPMGMVCENTLEGIKEAVRTICNNPKLIDDMNRNILNARLTFDYSRHLSDMDRLYEDALKCEKAIK